MSDYKLKHTPDFVTVSFTPEEVAMISFGLGMYASLEGFNIDAIRKTYGIIERLVGKLMPLPDEFK